MTHPRRPIMGDARGAGRLRPVTLLSAVTLVAADPVW